MPIRPENRGRYPDDWRAIVARIRERSGDRCEGSPAYPDCRAWDGEPHPVTGSIVVLTVAHLDHVPEHCDDANLRHWCQRCHNTYDAPTRRRGVMARAFADRAIGDLFAPPVEQQRCGTCVVFNSVYGVSGQCSIAGNVTATTDPVRTDCWFSTAQLKAPRYGAK